MAALASHLALGSDYVLTSAVLGSADFEQHHAHWLADGRMAMFDNRKDPPKRSRLHGLSVDEASQQMSIKAAYQLPRPCDSQKEAWHTPVGHPPRVLPPGRATSLTR